MSDRDGVIEGRTLILRDSEGRVRVELAGEAVYVDPPTILSGPKLTFRDADGTPRLSVGFTSKDNPPSIDPYSVAAVTFHTRDGRENITLTSFGEYGFLRFMSKKENLGLSVGFGLLTNEPEIVLASDEGWRMMLTVLEDQPHLTFYDGNDKPRLHLTVDRRGKPHVRRYFWRWLIPRGWWWDRYPREGAGG